MTCITDELNTLKTQLQQLETTVAALPDPIAGPQGEQGIQGPQGATGPSGADGFDSGTRHDILVYRGQSLTQKRAPQINGSADISHTALMFKGGINADDMNQPAPNGSNYFSFGPPHQNFDSFSAPTQPAGFETYLPGWAKQAELAGATHSHVVIPGDGGRSGAQLWDGNNTPNAVMENQLLRYQELTQAPGVTYNVRTVFSHGHANLDTLADGGGSSVTPVTDAEYRRILEKGEIVTRFGIIKGLGQLYSHPIWLEPFLCGTFTADVKNEIQKAHIAARNGEFGNFRLLPPRSQFANEFDSDLTHPDGENIWYWAQLMHQYTHKSLSPPIMLAKEVVGGTVELTFDQPIKDPGVAIIENTGYPHSRKGFEVVDSAAAYADITSVDVISDYKVALTMSSVANLTGAWKVRNGMHYKAPNAVTAVYMPRTHICSQVDVGQASDGLTLLNPSLPQEI